jgi:hypothetical protein
MEPDPVNEGVLVDRPRVRSAVAQDLAVGLARSPDVRVGHRRKQRSSMASTSIRPGPTR